MTLNPIHLQHPISLYLLYLSHIKIGKVPLLREKIHRHLSIFGGRRRRLQVGSCNLSIGKHSRLRYLRVICLVYGLQRSVPYCSNFSSKRSKEKRQRYPAALFLFQHQTPSLLISIDFLRHLWFRFLANILFS